MTETTVEVIVEQYKSLLYDKDLARKTHNYAKIPEIDCQLDELKKKKVVLVEGD